LAAAWAPIGRHGDPVAPSVVNTVAFARALHLQLLLGIRPPAGVPGYAYTDAPAVRVELLGLLQAALRSSGPFAARTTS
jgi:hypothetical protein